MLAPPPAAAPPSPSSAPLPFESPSVSVSNLPAFPAPPAVAASSSNADSSASSPPHSALSSALSSVPLLPARCLPPDPLSLLRAGGFSVVCFLPPASVAFPAVSSVISRSTSSLSRVVPRPSLYLPPAPLPPPLPSRRLLCLPAPPLAPPPPAPATDIACKDKYVGNRTGGGETSWSVAGGSAPCRK